MSNPANDVKGWNLEDHIYGTIYGQATGDTIGLLTEFMSKEQTKLCYGEHKDLEFEHKLNDGHRCRWKEGDWTDDTDQMIVIMDSISENNGKLDTLDIAARLFMWKCRGYKELGDHVGMGIGDNTDQVMRHKLFKSEPHRVDVVDCGNRFLNWARKGFPDLGDLGGMGIGATTSHVLKHESFTTNPKAAAEAIWSKTGCVVAPNGSVMRTSILGIHQYDNIDAVIANATEISKVTHFDPRCVSACVAASAAIAFMLQRQPKHVLPDGSYNISVIMKDCYALAKLCLKGKNYKKHKKDLKKFMFAKKLSVLDLGEKQSIGYTYKAMGAAFWALRQTDFRTAMQQLVFEGGDADTNCAIAGALLGCKLGSSQLPPTWRDKLLHKDWLDPKIIKFLTIQAHLKTGDITAPAPVPAPTAEPEPAEVESSEGSPGTGKSPDTANPPDNPETTKNAAPVVDEP